MQPIAEAGGCYPHKSVWSHSQWQLFWDGNFFPPRAVFFQDQMVLSVGHWKSEHSGNCAIVTGISIPDVGTQRLKWVLFALLTDTFLLKSERLQGSAGSDTQPQRCLCLRSVTALLSMHGCNCKGVLGHVFPASSNLHKLSHKSNHS